MPTSLSLVLPLSTPRTARPHTPWLLLLALAACPVLAQAQGPRLDAELEARVIEWRRDIHAHPELSNRETRTAKLVDDHLRGLGIATRTGVAHTGVVGVLEGAKPGPVIALRADMDALPVTERVDLPFASEVRATYLGQEVGVMHACGHDTHVAMLMGAAEVLAGMRDELAGTVVFLFQPAEEGAPPGEEGGAELMVREGALRDPDVDAAFGIHINSQTPVGTIKYRPRGTMAAADRFVIDVHGKQAHGSRPWQSVDPIVTGAHIVTALQTAVSRNAELTKAGVVVTVGKFDAGVRNNIIPESAQLVGTIRTLDTAMQRRVHADVRRIARGVAEAMGATVDVEIKSHVPVTFNDPDLTAQLLPTLQRAAGADNVKLVDAVTGAEDFSFYANEVPALFVFVGGMDPALSPGEAAGHHTPDFRIDERGLALGVRTYVNVALDYLAAGAR